MAIKEGWTEKESPLKIKAHCRQQAQADERDVSIGSMCLSVRERVGTTAEQCVDTGASRGSVVIQSRIQKKDTGVPAKVGIYPYAHRVARNKQGHSTRKYSKITKQCSSMP